MSTMFYAEYGPQTANRWKLNEPGHIRILANNIEEAREITAFWFGFEPAATVTIHRPDTPQQASCDRITRTIERPQKG